MKVYLKPGDEIEALGVLHVNDQGDFDFGGISEAAEGKNLAIWVPDDSPDEGQWYEVKCDAAAGRYCYDDGEPLD